MDIENINMKLRSQILEYSLFMEKMVNDLLLLNLGIHDKKVKTKLFSNKGKISFQNKIDLLIDIEVLSNSENLDFELLMIIRNKFMHDIECNSFHNLFSQLDNGIVNRFKEHLEEGALITDEESCKRACYSVFQKNIGVIRKKIDLNKAEQDKKYKFFLAQNRRLGFYVDTIYALMENISKVTEKSELENPKVGVLGIEILNILKETVDHLEVQSDKNIFEEFFKSDDDVRAVFGIKKGIKDLPKWEDYKNTKE